LLRTKRTFCVQDGFLQLNFLFESFDGCSMILLLVLVSAGVVREGLVAVVALMYITSLRLVLVLDHVGLHISL
jgi:hypothetical protein